MARGRHSRARRWGDLGIRAASAFILAPLALTTLWVGGWAFGVLVVLAGVGLATEWVQLSRPLTGRPAMLVIGAVTATLILASIGYYAWALGLIVLAPIMVGLPGAARFGLLAGIPYLALGGLAALWLRDDPIAGRSNMLFVLLLIWGSDIGSYVAGRLLQGPRMAPRISPAKTWSGAAGGLLAAVAVGWAAALWLDPPVEPIRVTALAAGLGIVAQGGDLFESWIKRRFGVKDSGRLIPGHGGLLDRLDAVLVAAPAAAALALFAGRGVVLWQ